MEKLKRWEILPEHRDHFRVSFPQINQYIMKILQRAVTKGP